MLVAAVYHEVRAELGRLYRYVITKINELPGNETD